jgi:hypothetical protein
MYDNINMGSTIAVSMHDNINMGSTIAVSMYDIINMGSNVKCGLLSGSGTCAGFVYHLFIYTLPLAIQ